MSRIRDAISDFWARSRWGLSRATTRAAINDSVSRHPAGKGESMTDAEIRALQAENERLRRLVVSLAAEDDPEKIAEFKRRFPTATTVELVDCLICEHGETGPHWWDSEGTYSNGPARRCPGPAEPSGGESVTNHPEDDLGIYKRCRPCRHEIGCCFHPRQQPRKVRLLRTLGDWWSRFRHSGGQWSLPPRLRGQRSGKGTP
jgi:hypothetical protein